jgi:hypothetical protein
METDAPCDYWISEKLNQHAIAEHPHDEQSPTSRRLGDAQFAEFQRQLEDSTTQVVPSGRFTFKCGMGARRVKLAPGEECVERSYWFEMPGSTRANPLYTIVHAHFSGLWRDYEKHPSDELAGSITQINVRHSCAGPHLKFKDEKFYGIAAEREGGTCIFDHQRHGGPWNWRQDQAIIGQANTDDGFVQPGRPRKPAWVLRLLHLFDPHPFYRVLRDVEDSSPGTMAHDAVELGAGPSCGAAESTFTAHRFYGKPMAQGAIPQWQNGVVAIGARRSGSTEPILMGTGWLVDLSAGLLCTCAHVVMDCYPHMQRRRCAWTR